MISSHTRSPRLVAQTRRLREAHLESVKERAQRDIQRAEEAAARKRRAAADDARKLIEKMEAASQKLDAHKQEQKDKVEKEKARRAEAHQAALKARQSAQEDVSKRGEEKAIRTSRAAESRTEKIASQVKRNQSHLKHALSVFEKKKSESGSDSSRGADSAREEAGAPLSPHPDKPQASTPEKKPALGNLGLQLNGSSGNDTPRGAAEPVAKVATPRASPRRTPELPTIREEAVIENLPGDPVDVPEVSMPNGMRCVLT